MEGSWKSTRNVFLNEEAPVESVEEPGEFPQLDQTDNCQTNLSTNEEFNITKRILFGSD
jgi:hypothetical protein